MRRLFHTAAAAMVIALTTGLGAMPSPHEAATKVTDAYVTHLLAGQPYRAVDECFDMSSFNRRVFGAEMDKLSPAEVMYLKQLSTVLVKAAITTLPVEIMRDGKMSPGTVKGETDSAIRVAYLFTLPAEKTKNRKGYRHESTFVVERTSAGWKIVDLEPVAAVAAKGFKKFPAGQASPIVFMEGMIVGVLDRKFETWDKLDFGGPAKTASPRSKGAVGMSKEAQAGLIRAQVKTLQNQIELYKAKTKKYPDLAGEGWQVLIKNGYISRAPVNPVNNRADLVAGRKGVANKGWHYDIETGTFGACYYDEDTDQLTNKP